MPGMLEGEIGGAPVLTGDGNSAEKLAGAALQLAWKILWTEEPGGLQSMG